MKIVTLVENKQRGSGLAERHGLSLYIEIGDNKLLFDVGPDDSFIENAKKLNVNLEEVDYCIISHGHYDHGGGLKAFFEVNSKAPVYISQLAFEPYYSQRDLSSETKTYIGLDKELEKNSRIQTIADFYQLTENILLFGRVLNSDLIPSDNARLYTMKNGHYILDSFEHEIYMLMEDEGKQYLISGCSHRGIINIIKETLDILTYQKKKPELDIVLGGFHLKNLVPTNPSDQIYLNQLIKKLNSFNVRQYMTGHCTGENVYEYMKSIMENKICDFATGDIFITES